MIEESSLSVDEAAQAAWLAAYELMLQETQESASWWVVCQNDDDAHVYQHSRLGRSAADEGHLMNTHTFTTNLKLGGIAFGVRGHLDFHVVRLTVGQIEITRTHPKYRAFPDEKCYTEKCMCVETGVGSGTVWEYGVTIFMTEEAAKQACIRHEQAAYKLRAERDAREAEQAAREAKEELAELARLKKKYGGA